MATIMKDRGNSSEVEHRLAKARVAGSNPVSRSIFLHMRKSQEIWRHSQVARQRSAKPLYPGSNPGAASIAFARLFPRSV